MIKDLLQQIKIQAQEILHNGVDKMYSIINCSQKCKYQNDGKCNKNSAKKESTSTNCVSNCIFYKESNYFTSKNARNFWTKLSHDCF